MDKFDVLQVIATVIAFALAASKLLRATVPFWGSMPPTLQRWAPGGLLVLGALPNALAGVTTWTDFGVAVMGAFALAMPGTHKYPTTPEPKAQRDEEPPWPPPPVATLMLGLALLGSGQACTPGQAIGPCTPTDFTTMEIKAAECDERVKRECPSYVKGSCSKERGVPCESCQAVTDCKVWFEQRCAS